MPQIELPLCPSMNVYWRVFRGRVKLSQAAEAFKAETLRVAVMRRVVRPGHEPVRVSICYHPKSRQRETGKPLRRMDVDNVIKPTLDALIGIAYHDDRSVVAVSSTLGEPVKGGRLVVSWERVNDV